MKIQGRKEVAEGVLIAALSTLAAELICWGVGALKQRQAQAAKAEQKKRKKRK